MGDTICFPELAAAGIVQEVTQGPSDLAVALYRTVFTKKVKKRKVKKCLPDEETLTFIRTRLIYLLDTGNVYFKEMSGNVLAGYKSTSKGKKTRMKVSSGGENLELADVCWFLKTGHWPKWGVTHVDGDKMNNKWVNLRKRQKPRKCGGCE